MGYQPERLAAGIFLFFYTLFASIPLLLFIFKVSTDSGSHYSLLSGVGPLEVKGLLWIEKYFSSSTRFLFLRSFILIGGGLLRVFCLGASDLKILIAYSSVVHMALIVIGFK